MKAPAAPRVSVVVPTHNAGPLLDETLDSVLAQTLQGVEVIVVDDGSSDGSAERVRRGYPGVRVVEQPRAGVSAARNRGLALARGRFVAFLDQDDVWHPEQLARQVAWLERHPETAAVATPYAFWTPAPDGLAQRPAPPPDPGLQPVPGFDGWTYHRFLLDCWALTSATLLRTDIVRAIGGFDPALPYAEDWDLWLRLSHRHRFAQIAWPPVLYRQHAVQGSRSVRRTDHRCALLTRTARAHGLASADGQAIGVATFRAQIARYRMEFGYHHLQRGHRWTGVRSLLHAWILQPWRTRWLALAALGTLGWRPKRCTSSDLPGLDSHP